MWEKAREPVVVPEMALPWKMGETNGERVGNPGVVMVRLSCPNR